MICITNWFSLAGLLLKWSLPTNLLFQHPLSCESYTLSCRGDLIIKWLKQRWNIQHTPNTYHPMTCPPYTLPGKPGIVGNSPCRENTFVHGQPTYSATRIVGSDRPGFKDAEMCPVMWNGYTIYTLQMKLIKSSYIIHDCRLSIILYILVSSKYKLVRPKDEYELGYSWFS